MKLSKMRTARNGKIGAAFLVAGLALVASFQNCGAGFQALNFSKGDSASSADQVEAPKNNFFGDEHAVMGDMAVPIDAYKRLQKAPTGIRASANLPEGIIPWPAGRIPVVIPKFVFDTQSVNGTRRPVALRPATDTEFNSFRSSVAEVCRIWGEVANITCAISENTNYFLENTVTAFILTNEDTQWCGTDPTVSCANVGGPGVKKTNGESATTQWMAIRLASVANKGLVLHEFGHVLGLLHEHQRSDAGNFLVVSPALSETQRASYLQLTSYISVVPNAKFDWASVMMYPAKGELNVDFLAGKAPLGIRKEYFSEATGPVTVRGQVTARPSVQDVQVVRMIYGPPATTAGRAACTLNGQSIPHGSFAPIYLNEETNATTTYTTCGAAVRLCDNSVLSGTSTKETCNVHCSVGATEIRYGFSKDFYQTASVPFGQTCVKQSRTCTATGVTTPAGQAAFTFASCSVQPQNPGTPPVMCATMQRPIESATNSAGAKTTCVATLPASPVSPSRISASTSNGGSLSAVCGANGTYVDFQMSCPAPADPPGTTEIPCQAQTTVIDSDMNAAGMKTTCVATWSLTQPSPSVRATANVSNGGTSTAICMSNGSFTDVRSTCPKPADQPPTTTPPVAAVFSCTPLKPYLQAYSLDGKIIPASTDANKPGFFFVAGFDPNERVWWSFDGAAWSKHAANVNSSFAAIGGATSLFPTGVQGAIFRNADLTPFPNGQLYVGYGVGATPIAAWDEMLAGVRYRLCDVLPSLPEECINSSGNRIPGCVYR